MYSLYDRISGNAIYLLIQMMRYTCRKQFVGLEHVHQALDGDRPVIFTSWHGRAFMAMSCLTSVVDVSRVAGRFSIFMPDDWRAGTIAVVASKIGATPFPMNLHGDSTLGMGREMVKVVRRIVEGGCTYIAPDGPDGPVYVPKPGVTYIARKANAIIVPVGAYCRHAYQLNRWDSYTIPYPFSRVSVHIGEPYSVPGDQKDLKHMNERLTDILHRVTAQAEANYYAHRSSWRRD